MNVVDISGVSVVSDAEALETVLMKRSAEGSNSFWLSHEGHEYPMLSVLVKHDLATLNYLPKECDAGFRSVGGTALKPGETTAFSITRNRADDVAVLNDAVVPFSAALRAAEEFFLSGTLPESIEWLRL